MRNVFNDPDLEKKFQRDGYVIVPFLEEEEVKEMWKVYKDTLPESGGLITSDDAHLKERITYDFTFIDKNIAYKELVFKVITERFDKYVKKYLADYTPIIANFIRKRTNDGEVPLHQNWAFVDERKYTSVSIWCPLIDSNEQNGTLQVVPGSHKRYGEFRGPMVPWELENIKMDIINKHLTLMNVKAGQAVILDDSIVHYSALNKTDELRLAIQLILIPGEVRSIHYHMNPQKSTNRIEVLEVDRDFYMNFNPWKQPEHVNRLQTIPYKPSQMNIKEFERGLYNTRIDEMTQRKSLVEKLKAVFS